MAALFGLEQADLRRNVVCRRQEAGGQEGVVTRVQQQGLYGDVAQVGFGGGAAVVVVFVGEAVQGRGVGVVEIAQCADADIRQRRHFRQQAV